MRAIRSNDRTRCAGRTASGAGSEALRRASGPTSSGEGKEPEQLDQTMNSLPSVMQGGRWADTRTPMRYGERVLASRGAMARAAKVQGRG